MRSKEIEDRAAKGEPIMDMSEAINRDLNMATAHPPQSPATVASTRQQLSQLSVQEQQSCSMDSMSSIGSLLLPSPDGPVRQFIDSVHKSGADGAEVS